MAPKGLFLGSLPVGIKDDLSKYWEVPKTRHAFSEWPIDQSKGEYTSKLDLINTEKSLSVCLSGMHDHTITPINLIFDTQVHCYVP